MASHKTTTTNLFSVLSPEEDMPSPQIPSDHETPEPSRRKQKKAAKAEARAEEERAAAAKVEKSAVHVKEKPAGWKASSTMAQIKELKQVEALAKHHAMHPLKVAADKAVATWAFNTASSKGKGKAPQHNDHVKTGTEDGKAFVAGCGLQGCPVRHNHPPRPYSIDDYQLPAYIKTLYFQWPSAQDTEKVKRFFKAHEETAVKTVKWTTNW